MLPSGSLAGKSYSSASTQGGPPEIANNGVFHASATSRFRLAFVATQRPPRWGLQNQRRPERSLLIDATSNWSREGGGWAYNEERRTGIASNRPKPYFI